MVNKILFLTSTPPDERDYERFGVKFLQKNGFEVEITNGFDLDLEQIRGLSPDTLIVNSVGYSRKSYSLYKAISSSRAKHAVFMANAVPVPPGRNKFIHRIRRLTLPRLANYMFQHIPFSLFGVEPADIILAGGEQCLKSTYPVSKKTHILWAHTLDYDLYLKERNKPARKQDTAVFLDEYYPFHPDWNLLYNVENPIDPNIYYSTLDGFFTRIEKELGLEVVIAAHPCSEYEKQPDYFKGRKVVKNKTCELVKSSQMVMSHSSTSLSFACLFHKPVIFLTSREIGRGRQSPLTHTMAGWLGKTPVNMYDPSVNLEKELSIDAAAYSRYKQAYIKTSQSPDIPFWQIVADYLHKEAGY